MPEVPQIPSYMQKDMSIQTFINIDPAPWPNHRAIPKSKSEDVLTGGADEILKMISDTFGQSGIGQFLDVILTCCDDKSPVAAIQNTSFSSRVRTIASLCPFFSPVTHPGMCLETMSSSNLRPAGDCQKRDDFKQIK